MAPLWNFHVPGQRLRRWSFYCAKNGGLKTCPSLGDRYEQTFAVMIATTLALLTGKHDKTNV